MNSEARRVQVGPAPGQRPDGLAIMQVDVSCAGNAATVLERVRDRCERKWPSLLGYNRDWSWWHAKVISPDHLALFIDVTGFPISGFDFLRTFMFRYKGVEAVEQGPVVSEEDILVLLSQNAGCFGHDSGSSGCGARDSDG